MSEINPEISDVKKTVFWNKRIVLFADIFLCIVTFILFVVFAYLGNELWEGIFSNCFTAFAVTLLGVIIDWKTETDVERTIRAVEQETKRRIDEMQTSTDQLSRKLDDDIQSLEHSIKTFSHTIDLYNGKACTFCKNSIRDIKLNRDDCNLEAFFRSAKHSISILATNLESFVEYLNVFSSMAKSGVKIKIATIHPNFARDFNISRVVGRTNPEKRWRDMKDSLLKFMTFSESDDYNGNKIEIKLYTDITPTLIMMMVDDECYVSYLLHGQRSRETPHFLFCGNGNVDSSAFSGFNKHFNGIWDDPGTIECTLAQIASLEYQPKEQMQQYNYYGHEFANLRNAFGLSIHEMYVIFRGIWSEQTCTPRLRANWSKGNPSVGQCSITSFLVQDYFGGKVLGIPLEDGHFHCYNVIDGYIFDFTSEQFGSTQLSYNIDSDPEQNREEHFQREEKKQRYQSLRVMLQEELRKWKPT